MRANGRQAASLERAGATLRLPERHRGDGGVPAEASWQQGSGREPGLAERVPPRTCRWSDVYPARGEQRHGRRNSRAPAGAVGLPTTGAGAWRAVDSCCQRVPVQRGQGRACQSVAATSTRKRHKLPRHPTPLPLGRVAASRGQHAHASPASLALGCTQLLPVGWMVMRRSCSGAIRVGYHYRLADPPRGLGRACLLSLVCQLDETRQSASEAPGSLGTGVDGVEAAASAFVDPRRHSCYGIPRGCGITRHPLISK